MELENRIIFGQPSTKLMVARMTFLKLVGLDTMEPTLKKDMSALTSIEDFSFIRTFE